MTFYVTWLPWSTMWRKRPCEPISSTTKSTLSVWTPFSLRYCPCLCWYTWIPPLSLLSTKWANLPTFPVAVNGRPILFKGLSKKEVDSECANKTFDYFEKNQFFFSSSKVLGQSLKISLQRHHERPPIPAERSPMLENKGRRSTEEYEIQEIK